MRRKAGKKRHTLLIVLAILLAVPAIGALILMTHTQIIVGAIQKMAADTVNTVNSYEPSGEPMEGIKDNGQYIITELKYSELTRMKTGKHHGRLLFTFMAVDSSAAVRVSGILLLKVMQPHY